MRLSSRVDTGKGQLATREFDGVKRAPFAGLEAGALSKELISGCRGEALFG
jgi:hypothetical protein